VNFLFGKNRLRLAIERGLATGKLEEEIRGLEEVTLKSKADGEAVCWGLEQVAKNPKGNLGDNVHALAGLFQDVKDGDCAAFDVLRERGIPLLLEFFDQIRNSSGAEQKDTSLFILKVLALYGTTDGTLKIIETARDNFSKDGYMWSVILRSFSPEHPQSELLFNSLRDSLPAGFIGIALLDAANQFLIGGGEMSHPFDSPAGRKRLRGWLMNSDSEENSYAHSATAALPFVCNPEREELQGIAGRHPDPGVRMEAAWAGAKTGDELGLKQLVDFCTDFNHAQTAQHYLAELGREELIPVSAKEPDFMALAEFARWLAHPNELGKPPDKLEIIDHRLIAWPPERSAKPFWLIQYEVKAATALDDDDVGCGLVGSKTFCFFSYELTQRPPEDAYAVHCYWEMRQADLIEESDVSEKPAEYEVLLKHWRGSKLENPNLERIAEISPELKHPERLVGVASARLEGADGWVVLDGPRSEWYPASDMPKKTPASTVLEIHVGRQLLGLLDRPDRSKYLAAPKPPKPAEIIVAAFETLLADAQKLQGESRKKTFERHYPIRTHFDAYAECLAGLGRGADILPVIELLAPYWEDCGGYLQLGRAAWKCRQAEVAERWLTTARNNCENWERCDEVALLAGIWLNRGRETEAKALLVECLKRLLAESKTATGSDRRFFERFFQERRNEFLKLFPADADSLAASGIPDSTLS
jgi:hypothetical protein